MKHVTCFITSLSSGGAEHQLSELASMLYHEGYKVSLVTFSDISDFYILDPQIERILICKGKNSLIKICGIFFHFLRSKTDVVISFGQRENLFALIPLLFRPKIKFIAGERNFTIGSQSFIEKILFNILYKRANWIVPNSYSQKKHIIKHCEEYRKKTKTIINYTDTNKYYPKTINKSKPISIAIFCRYDKQKNYERFAHAIHKLTEKTDIPFVVYWFGNKTFKDTSPNPCYVHFSNIITELGINNKIFLNNHVSNVNEIMQKYDGFCLPSLYEGFSNSLSEAICCGMPILASNVSDNPSMVNDGRNGFLFNPLKIDEIADAICKFLLLSDEERKAFGVESRKLAEQLFNKEVFINKYISLIEN